MLFAKINADLSTRGAKTRPTAMGKGCCKEALRPIASCRDEVFLDLSGARYNASNKAIVDSLELDYAELAVIPQFD